MSLGCFLREVARSIFLLGVDLCSGFYIQVCPYRLAVFFVAKTPEHTGNRIRIVIEWEESGANGRAPVRTMSVIKHRAPDAHGNVRGSPMYLIGTHQATLAGNDRHCALVIDRITCEIGSGIQLSQFLLGPV